MMDIDLTKLGAEVADQLARFVAADRKGALGEELPKGWEENQLSDMQSALVPPYIARLRDCDAGGALVILLAAVVVDDAAGSLVLYDPSADEFVLAVRDLDPDRARAVDVVSCGVRGNAVDCFLSR